MKVIWFVLCIAVAGTLAKTVNVSSKRTPGSSRISNGALASDGQFPWVVLVEFKGGPPGLHLCGGALISSNWVLSAAHCTQNVIDISVTAGTTLSDHSDSNEVVSLQNDATIHPSFDPITSNNDVAVIYAHEAFSFSNQIQPIHMALKEPPIGSTVIASGWGRIESSGAFSTELRYASLATIRDKPCEDEFGFLGIPVPDNMFCARADDSSSTCHRDNGGPLIYQDAEGVWNHVGVITYTGTFVCNDKRPSVYGSTSRHRRWITSVTQVS